MERGVFWLIDGDLLAVLYDEEASFGIAKSGNNYNHKLLWDHVKPPKCNKPFDYYPRGRVEIANKGTPVIYMSSHIGEEFLKVIMDAFHISGTVKIHYDGSNHYKCHLDR